MKELLWKTFVKDYENYKDPLEATVAQENFEVARAAGFNQWRGAGKTGEARLYPMDEAWKKYKAVSVPESDTDIELPPVEKILRYLR